mgnify:CR=1 FL=1
MSNEHNNSKHMCYNLIVKKIRLTCNTYYADHYSSSITGGHHSYGYAKDAESKEIFDREDFYKTRVNNMLLVLGRYNYKYV